uniref:Uncharacterized protein n=1 Tax=Bracon brevicornis TaxID=1563983 RepID=A0A6V7IKF9_9HYME
MNLKIGILLFLLAVSAARAADEVCEDQGVAFRKCERGNVLTKVTKDSSTARYFPGLKSVFMDFSEDKEIAPNAFSEVDLTGLWITMPYINRKNGSSLKSLTLHADSFAGLDNLEELHVSNANITFEGNPFGHLRKLMELELSAGELTEIPETIRSLPNLRKLSLERNRITRVPGNIFALRNTPLKELDLRSNKIERLEPGWSNGLEQLDQLILMGNNIAPEPELFSGIRNVKKLLISGAFEGHEFQKEMIRNLPHLTSLSIGYNRIRTLEPGMFNDSPQLEELSLYKSALTNVPRGVFEGLTSLKDLTLADGIVETIEPGAFSGLHVDFLGLHVNQIKTIEPRTFNNTRVGRLYLGENKIQNIKPHAFDGLTARMVDLTDNKISTIGADDFSGLNTNDLDLSGNQIASIAPGAFSNAKLKRLGIYRTPLKAANRAAWGLAESVQILN